MTEPHAVIRIDNTVYIHIQEEHIAEDVRLEFPQKRVPKKYRRYLK